MPEMEIPAFLRRTPPTGAQPVTTPTTEPKTKTRRQDCYVIRQTVRIPLDMTNAASLGDAIKAAAGMGKDLPEGSTIETAGKPTMGKM